MHQLNERKRGEKKLNECYYYVTAASNAGELRRDNP